MSFFNRYTVRFMTSLGAGVMVFGLAGAIGPHKADAIPLALAAGVGAAILTRGIIEMIRPNDPGSM